MHCPYCSQEHPAGTRYCPVSGKAMPAEKPRCRECQREIPENVRFCEHCSASQVAEGQNGKKRRTGWVVAGAVLLTLLLAGGLVCLIFFYGLVVLENISPTPQIQAGSNENGADEAGIQVEVISPENASQLQELVRLGKGTISEIVYSPDGKLLVVAGSIGLHVYEADSLVEIEYIETNFLLSAAFSPDGLTLASRSLDGTVRLWHTSDWSELGELSGHTEGATSLAFSPDGLTLASGSLDGTVRLWGVGP